MLVSQVYGFLAAYTVLVFLAMRTRRIYLILAVMIALYAVLSATLEAVYDAAIKLLQWNNLRVFFYIFFSMTLAGLMRETGLLEKMVDSLASSNCRLALTGVPALIGLMPMPGGALVSAIALKKKYLEEAKVSREDATYLNYWFRHLWVPSWPLFQSIVITATVFSLSPIEIVKHTWVATIAAILGGTLISYPVLRRVYCDRGNTGLGVFVASIAPLIGLIIFFLSGTEMLLSLVMIVALFAIVWRPNRKQWAGAMKLAGRPTIYLVLLESLFFKDLLLDTSIGSALKAAADSLGISMYLVIFMIPFLLGLAAGDENFYASTAMPAIIPYLVTSQGIAWELLAVGYLGGFMGVMGSPIHLCFALTVDYYKASVGRVLAKVYATILSTIAFGLLLIYLVYSVYS